MTITNKYILAKILIYLEPTDLRRLWNQSKIFHHIIQNYHKLSQRIHTCMVHLVSLGELEDIPTINDLTKKYPTITQFLLRGDLIENIDESGYRSTGIYMVDKINGNFSIVDQYYEFDDYGSPAIQFHAISQFPVDYWDNGNININSTLPDEHSIKESMFYWHGEFAMTAFYPHEVGLTSLESIAFKSPGRIEYKYNTFSYNNRNYLFIGNNNTNLQNSPLCVFTYKEILSEYCGGCLTSFNKIALKYGVNPITSVIADSSLY